MIQGLAQVDRRSRLNAMRRKRFGRFRRLKEVNGGGPPSRPDYRKTSNGRAPMSARPNGRTETYWPIILVSEPRSRPFTRPPS